VTNVTRIAGCHDTRGLVTRARDVGRRLLQSVLRPRPLPKRPLDRAVTLALFFVGASLCMGFLRSIAGTPSVAVAGALITGLFAVAGTRSERRFWRIAARLAWIALAGLHAFWAYQVLSFGVLLAWTTPWWLRAAALALSAAALAGAASPSWERARVPVSLPAGVWIVGCLLGWLDEVQFARCDDYRSLLQQRGTSLVPVTTGALEACREGERQSIFRYPRKVWESPDGKRYVFTTQVENPSINPHVPTPGRLSGSVCEAATDGRSEPRCVGFSKAHGIVEAEDRDRLFAAAWGFRKEGLNGVIYELPRSGPLEVLREVKLKGAADMFYEPASGRLGVFTDEGIEMLPVRADDLTPEPPVPTPVVPGELRYDAARHEGLLCMAAGPLRTLEGGAFLAVAFKGLPYSIRPLGRSGSSPWVWLALSWGCDWDRARGEVHVGVPTLGLLTTVSYEDGRVLRSRFVGFGIRSVTFDPKRRRVYMASFLKGEVIAMDPDTGRETARWFAGRFLRDVRLSRGGDHLLVTSNMGIVRIALE
jgi:hypothetical protein